MAQLFDAVDRGQISAVTSELTLAELLVKPFRDGDAAEEAACRAMPLGGPHLAVAPVTQAIWVESARVRAKASLKLPDAVHVGTAGLNACDLFLTNDAAFRTAGIAIDVVLQPETMP